MGAQVAQFQLKAGGLIDLLTKKELDHSLSGLHKTITKLSARQWLTTGEVVTTDASGNLGGGAIGNGVSLYAAPTGRIAELHRIAVAAQGYTPSAPLTSGWLAWYRGGPSLTGLLMVLPVGGAVAPAVVTEGTNSAALIRNGEECVIVGGGLPANTSFGISIQLSLREISK